jgi:5-(carboxyamino)imidazole ribonucleotide synthase
MALDAEPSLMKTVAQTQPPSGDETRIAPTLGIIGGGQLAKMTAQAASQLGCETVVLERKAEFPAASLDTHTLVGDWDNPAWLLKLGAMSDVVTLENEFVDARALAALEREGHKLLPRAATIAAVQDKLTQKRTFAAAGLPLPAFADTPDRAAVLKAGEQFGFPLLLKKRRNSYDGKGNFTVASAQEVDTAWRALDGDHAALYAEAFCEFVMELAVIVARGQDGATVVYPVVETINRDHICNIVKAPAVVSAQTAAEAVEIATRAVQAVDGIGAMGLEIFLTKDGKLLVNEIAPRVHNTGHYTIEACECSQFENHVRAVLGLPLGSSRMIAPAAVMVNLLGAGEGSGKPRGLAEALRVAGAHVHIYGKTRSARGRKMGHVTALGQSVDEAMEIAHRAASRIRFGE